MSACPEHVCPLLDWSTDPAHIVIAVVQGVFFLVVAREKNDVLTLGVLNCCGESLAVVGSAYRSDLK